MKNIIYISVFITIILAICCFIAWFKRKKIVDHKLYSLHFGNAVGAIVSAAAFLGVMILSSTNAKDILTSILFFMLVLLCWIIMIAYLNCVIHYDDDGFVAKNFFGIKRKCTYEDVEGVREKSSECRIYFNGKSILVETRSSSGFNFVCDLRNNYKIRTGRELPFSDSFSPKEKDK